MALMISLQKLTDTVQVDLPGSKSDRSTSPTPMTEDGRRDLIARQHRALYGNESSLYTDGMNNPQSSQDARVSAGMVSGSGQRPLAFDPFGMQGQNRMAENGGQPSPREQNQPEDASSGSSHQQQYQQPPQQRRSRANSTSSPSSNPTNSFSLFDSAAQQSSRTSNSSPGGSPPRQGASTISAGGVAPIGTRPTQGQGQVSHAGINPAFNKRTTTPLPSPLSFGFSTGEHAAEGQSGNKGKNSVSGPANPNERSSSAASNPSSAVTEKGVNLGWGSNSAVWGSSKGSLGVQASVWG